MADELEIEIDEIELLIHGHVVYTTFQGFAVFNPQKQILRIEQLGQWQTWKRCYERLEVCPVQSKPLYDALHAAVLAQYGAQIDDEIADWWSDHPENFDREAPPARRIRDYL